NGGGCFGVDRARSLFWSTPWCSNGAARLAGEFSGRDLVPPQSSGLASCCTHRTLSRIGIESPASRRAGGQRSRLVISDRQRRIAGFDGGRGTKSRRSELASSEVLSFSW